MINYIFAEIVSENLDFFVCYALIKSQVNFDIQKAQYNVVLEPLTEKIGAFFKTQKFLEDKINRVYLKLQTENYAFPDYGKNNLIELCRYLKVKLS